MIPRFTARASRITAPIAAWGLAAAIVVLSVVPPSLRPETALPHKLEHFVVYWAAGIAFALAYALTPLLAAFLVLFSGAIEILQVVIPGRHARLSDFIVDAMACIIGLLVVPLLAQIRGRTRT